MPKITSGGVSYEAGHEPGAGEEHVREVVSGEDAPAVVPADDGRQPSVEAVPAEAGDAEPEGDEPPAVVPEAPKPAAPPRTPPRRTPPPSGDA